jgi:hypothetical protein
MIVSSLCESKIYGCEIAWEICLKLCDRSRNIRLRWETSETVWKDGETGKERQQKGRTSFDPALAL